MFLLSFFSFSVFFPSSPPLHFYVLFFVSFFIVLEEYMRLFGHRYLGFYFSPFQCCQNSLLFFLKRASKGRCRLRLKLRVLSVPLGTQQSLFLSSYFDPKIIDYGKFLKTPCVESPVKSLRHEPPLLRKSHLWEQWWLIGNDTRLKSCSPGFKCSNLPSLQCTASP